MTCLRCGEEMKAGIIVGNAKSKTFVRYDCPNGHSTIGNYDAKARRETK